MKLGFRTLARFCPILGIVALALLPSDAPAATNGSAALSGGTLSYFSDNSRNNQLTVSQSGGSLVLTDPGAQTITDADGSGGCVVSGATATCPSASVARLSIDSGGGTDTITVAPTVAINATIVTGNGRDVIKGGAGNDFLASGGGADEVHGGGGIDTVDYSDRGQKVSVSLDGVNNDGQGSERDNVMPDVENVIGGSKDDTLIGSDADNAFDGGLGKDTFEGGDGVDTVSYAGRTTSVIADIDSAADDGAAGESDLIGEDIENLVGGSGSDTLTGSAEDNLLDGGLGADVLRGGEGSDTVSYRSRTTAVTVTPGDGPNDGQAGEGDNVAGDVEGVLGGSGDDRFVSGPGDGVFQGGPGNDAIDYSARGAGVDVSLDDTAGDGEAGESDNVASDVEIVLGGVADDNIDGSDGPNLLVGNGGSDSIEGEAGDDLLVGGDGDDLLDGGDGADILRGEAGVDSYDSGDGNDAIVSNDQIGEDVVCGDGADNVDADKFDLVDEDCEKISGFVAGAAVQIVSSKLRMASDGTTLVKVRCVKTNGDCEGTLALETRARKLKGRSVAPKRISRGDLSVFTGDVDTVELTIPKGLRKQVRSKRGLAARVRSRIARTPDVSRSVQITSSKRKKSSAKRRKR